MKSQTQTQNNLFFNIFPRIQNEMKNVTDFKCLINNPFDHDNHLKQDLLIKGHIFDWKLEKMATYQTENLIIYCGLRQSKLRKGENNVVFLYFSKKKGDKQEKQTFCIDDDVTAQTLGLVYNKGRPALSYIIGTRTGLIKIFSYYDKPFSQKLKLHTVPVRDIKVATSNKLFNHKSIVLILTQDQTIFIANLQKLQVVAQYKCGTISLRNPIKIIIHHSHQYFAQIFDDGCIHIWEITKQTIEKIKESHYQKTGLFKKFYGIIPVYQVHSVSTSGIIDSVFFGKFMLVLTSKNGLKMIAFDNTIERTYMTIFSEQVQNSENSNKPLNFKKIQILPQISSIFVLSQRNLFQFIYNNYDIIGMKSLRFQGLVNLDDFSISRQQLLILTGSSKEGLPKIFIQKLSLQNNISTVASNYKSSKNQFRSSSNSHNLLIN